jgi:putative transposase
MTFNALLNRKGHFWEQRYSCHGFPNHDRQRALNTLRYIHANPKAAGMKTSFFYDFSNYGSYHQLSHDGLSQWHPAFLALAPNLDDCAQKYKGFCNRYTPRKKKTKINQWGKKSLAGLLGNRVTAKQKPVTTGQMSLPFYQPELVQVSLNPIAEQALSFIQANRFNYQFLA